MTNEFYSIKSTNNNSNARNSVLKKQYFYLIITNRTNFMFMEYSNIFADIFL